MKSTTSHEDQRTCAAPVAAQPAVRAEPVMRIYAEGSARIVLDWLDGSIDLQDGDHMLYTAPVAAQAQPAASAPTIDDDGMDRLVTILGRHERDEIGHQGLLDSIFAEFGHAAQVQPITSDEAKVCAEALRNGLSPTVKMFIPAGWNTLLDKLDAIATQQPVSGADGLHAYIAKLQDQRSVLERRVAQLEAAQPQPSGSVPHLADDTRVGILADSSYINGLRSGYALGQAGDEAEYQQIVAATRAQISDARSEIKAQPSGNARELHRFYGVETDADLIAAQQRHIEKLQARAGGSQPAVTRQREG